MLHEPGVPAYLRGPSRGLISLAVIAFGCVMAYVGAMQSWPLAGLACFGLVVTVLAFFRMEWAILGLVVMANFDGFLKPLFPDRVTLFLKDYFVLLATARWAWGLLSKEERPSVRTVIAAPALLFMGYVLAELANPNSRGLMLSLAGARAWLIWLPVFFIAHDYLRSRLDVERLWMLATVLGLVTGLYGILQYFIGFEHLYRLSSQFAYYAKMGYWTETGKVLRVFSTMVHPGAFGSAMGFVALAASGLAFSSRSSLWRLIAALTVPVAIVALFLSGSRAAMVGTALGIGVLIVLSKRPALLVAAGALLLAGFWQSSRVTEGGLGSRLETLTWEYTSERALGPFERGMDIAAEHPFGLGVSSGIGVARSELERGTPLPASQREKLFIENDLGRALAELGVGALLYVVLLVAAAVGGVMAYLRLRSPEDETLAAALLGGAISIAVTLAVGSSLYVVPGALYFWLGLATVMRLPDLAEREAETPATETQASAA